MNKILPTNDLAFKKVFATEENKYIISGLINDFFGIIAEDIQILNPYSIETVKKFSNGEQDINELRHTLRDVSVSFKTADFVSELQIWRTLYFEERSMYYPLKRFCENYNIPARVKIGSDGKPNRYSSLRPVYALNILGYNHFDDDDALRIFELYDPKRGKKPDKELLRIGYFELTKTAIETTNQRHWHDFFTTNEVKSEAPDYIKNASEVIDFANLGEEERKVFEEIEKARATIQDERDYCFFEGKAEGALETAMAMLAEGIPPEIVAKCAKLPLEKVLKLKSQLQIQS